MPFLLVQQPEIRPRRQIIRFGPEDPLPGRSGAGSVSQPKQGVAKIVPRVVMVGVPLQGRLKRVAGTSEISFRQICGAQVVPEFRIVGSETEAFLERRNGTVIILACRGQGDAQVVVQEPLAHAEADRLA